MQRCRTFFILYVAYHQHDRQANNLVDDNSETHLLARIMVMMAMVAFVLVF